MVGVHIQARLRGNKFQMCLVAKSFWYADGQPAFVDLTGDQIGLNRR
jgi:hypothetical protein